MCMGWLLQVSGLRKVAVGSEAEALALFFEVRKGSRLADMFEASAAVQARVHGVYTSLQTCV